MRKYLALLMCLFLLSCMPSCTWSYTAGGNGRSATIASGKFSCYGGQCCWPYLHHREVKDYHLMICSHETINKDGWNSANISLKSYFMYP